VPGSYYDSLLVVQTAHADSMDEVVVAHRGADTSKYAEGTAAAYQYAVRNRADMLEAMSGGRRTVAIPTPSAP
jgi:hypothetical protein